MTLFPDACFFEVSELSMKNTSANLTPHDTLMKMGINGNVGFDVMLDTTSEEFTPGLKGSSRCLDKFC